MNVTARPQRVVLGVGGGIAAYKVAHLARLITEAGHDLTVIPTEAALRFVGAPTWEALSGKPVRTLWDDVSSVPHVRIGQTADLLIVAPATADLMARAAHGLANDLLTNTLLMASAPVLMAPAMHTEMWLHPATRANVATLRSRGVVVLDPASGRLTGADSGPGRLPEPTEIFAAAMGVLGRGKTADLLGRTVVISAGGTREALDPVRFIGNRSSGLQGYAIAAAAAQRGAEVTIIAANVHLPAPAGVKVVAVETASELGQAMLEQAAHADVVVMAAAVADYRPVQVSTEKIKKGDADPVIALTKNEDILSALVDRRTESGAHQIIVGFAAETGGASVSAIDLARQKLRRKRCDLLVFNDVSDDQVFGSNQTNAVLLFADGPEENLGSLGKDTLADALLDRLSVRLP